MSRQISVPDEIYKDVEMVCGRLDMTPEEFISEAAKMMAFRNMTGEEFTARLDEIYENVDSSLDPVMVELQARSMEHNEWE